MADSLFSRWLRTAVALGVAGVAAAAAAWFYLRPRGDLDALASLVPAEASSAAFVRGLDRWAELARRLAEDPGANPSLRDWLAKQRASAQERLGFDGTDPKAWKQAGFEPDGTFGAVSLGVDPKQAQLFFFVPVRDPAKALAVVQRALGQEGGKVEERSDAGRKVYAVSWPPEQAAGKPGAFTFDGAFLVLCDASGATLDAPASLHQLYSRAGEPTLKDAEPFRAVRAELGERWTLMVYSAPSVTAKLAEAFRNSPALQGLGARGAGFALDASDSRLTAKLRVLNAPGWSAPFLGPVKAGGGDRVEGDPLAVARLSLNPGALVELAKKEPRAAADLDKLGKTFRDALDLDLEQDVLGNLDGQFNAVALRPAQAGATSQVVVAAKVKDANRAAAALDRLAAKLRSPLFPLVWEGTGPERWARFGAYAGGLAGGHLYLVSGPDAAVRAGVDPAQPGYTKRLAAPVRDALEHGPAVYAYLDLAASAKNLLAQTGALDPRAAAAAQATSAVSLGLDAREGALRADLDLFAGPGGFSQAAHALAAADGGSP